jgi:hypothetical protein
VADATAVPDQKVREPAPVGARDDALQVTLDLDRIFVAGQAEPLRQTANMCIHHNSLRAAELRGDHVRRLARDAGKPQ